MILKDYPLPSDVFDSHRPLHFQATSGRAGRQELGQGIDPMGKSWEIDAEEPAV